MKDTLAAQLAGHVDNFLALREKLAGAEAQLNTVSEKLQEVVGKCFDKLKITSDKLGELHKFTNQGIGEIMGTIKMVPATVVSVKASVERIAGLLDQVHPQTQESKTAIMEATTPLHDCKQMLVDNRQVLFTEMQRHLADVDAKCDSVAEKLYSLLETRLPEWPPYRRSASGAAEAGVLQPTGSHDLLHFGAPHAGAARDCGPPSVRTDAGDVDSASHEYDGPTKPTLMHFS